MDTYTKSNYFSLREIRNLKLQLQKLSEIKRNISKRINEHVSSYEYIERFLDYSRKSEAQGSVLEIGHGQIPLHAIYLSTKYKNVHGVDLDVVPERFDLRKLFEIFKQNGTSRFFKTLFREISGINRTYRNEICRHLGLPRYPTLNLIQKDIGDGLPYGDCVMDAVYSSDVFEHIKHPRAALLEAKRVLKNGSPFVMKTLHWGHYNALHDLGLIIGDIDRGWLHLLEDDGGYIYRGTYVNTLRIQDWITLVKEIFGDVEYEIIEHEESVKDQLELIYTNVKGNSTLKDFSKVELFASHLLIKGYK